ncbi:MAG: dihydrofolate reductase, partial [Lacticaseibacillus paracasei]
MVAFLWAQDRDGVIGKDGHLPWHLPDDLHYFRTQTEGKMMVVGRRTYESFPKRPLPDRTNVVLTHQADYQAPGAIVLHQVAEVLD